MATNLTGLYKGRGLLPFLGISLFLHALPAGLIWGLGLDLALPKPQISWLDLDNTLGAPGAIPKPPPPPPPPPPPEVKEEPAPVAKEGPKPAKKKKKRKKRAPDAGPPAPAVPFSTDKMALGELATGDASLMLLIRTDRLRKTPYAAQVRRLLQVFYDHKTLLYASGLDPIQDFDALLIATPNPYRLTRTLLAVRHSKPDRIMRRALSRAARYEDKKMFWKRNPKGHRGIIPSPPRLAHDPRVVIVRPGLALLMDPALLPALDQEPHRPAPGAPDAGTRPLTWAQRLTAMGQKGGGGAKEGPSLLLQGVNLPRLIRLPPGVPVPLSLQVSVEALEPAPAEGLLTFASEDDARKFMDDLPDHMDRARRSILLRLLGVVSLLDGIKLRRDGRQVWANMELTGDQLRQLLGLFREMIPQVRVPGLKGNRIPDSGVPDMGKTPDQGAPDAGMPDRGEDPALLTPAWAEE